MSDNPWVGIDPRGQAPYVLPEDHKFVAAFNASLVPRVDAAAASPPTFIRTDLMPEPWLGRRDAPVCLLLLNPGASPNDAALHADEACRARLHHAITSDDAPHFHLAEGAPPPGRRWWAAALSTLVREVGVRDAGDLQNAISCIQLFPYHSEGFGHAGIRLPSQEATVARVREQLARRTRLIVRSWPTWLGLVPELADDQHRDHVFPLSGRGVRVHPNTLGKRENFQRIVATVTGRIGT